MTVTNIDLENVQPVFDLDNWYNDLKPLHYSLLPGGKAIFVTDMINGFVHDGPLASPRVKALVPGIVDLCHRVDHGDGRGLLVSIQDSHRANALEFRSFPPHAKAGSVEAMLIHELRNTDFDWVTFEKNTLNPGIGSGSASLNSQLLGWTSKRNPQDNVGTHYTESFIVVGNCTDLCVYQTAMYLRQFFNAVHVPAARVIVPANLVDTYDGSGHDARFFNRTFLYHMALNGIEVVKEIL